MLWGSAVQGLGKDTLPLITAELLWVWALQEYVATGTAGTLWVGHCRNTLRLLLATTRILCCYYWALQGYSAVGHCRDTLRLGTEGILQLGTAGRDSLRLGTAEILGG